MADLEDLLERVRRLEGYRDADKAEAKSDRHTFRNDVNDVIAAMSTRVFILEKHLNGASIKAQIPWMRYVIAVQGAAIAFLAYRAFR